MARFLARIGQVHCGWIRILNSHTQSWPRIPTIGSLKGTIANVITQKASPEKGLIRYYTKGEQDIDELVTSLESCTRGLCIWERENGGEGTSSSSSGRVCPKFLNTIEAWTDLRVC